MEMGLGLVRVVIPFSDILKMEYKILYCKFGLRSCIFLKRNGRSMVGLLVLHTPVIRLKLLMVLTARYIYRALIVNSHYQLPQIGPLLKRIIKESYPPKRKKDCQALLLCLLNVPLFSFPNSPLFIF